VDRLKGENNMITLPDISQQSDTLCFMDNSSSLQITPFPGFEVQAVPAVLHHSAPVTLKQNGAKKEKKKSKLNNATLKVNGRVVNEKNKLVFNSGEVSYNGANKKNLDKFNKTLQENGERLETENKTVSKSKNNKNKLKSLDGVYKRPAAPSPKSSRLLGSSQTKQEPEIKEEAEEDEPEIQIILVPSDTVHLGIKSVLKKGNKPQEKSKKNKKSVQFGERMIREVTKIVYPWNEENQLSDNEEDFELRDDIELDIRVDDDDDGLDLSDSDSFDDSDTDSDDT
jgi:hypothetical protein